jgi:succinate dehydrogenase / fumarate reductase iron-sulfur subunit
VGDPRDDQHEIRLRDLAEDPQGIYDCTHCFKCVDACPKDVNPMGQIMRLRRIAGNDFNIVDQNNGERHEQAFVNNIRRNGLLHESDLLADSFGGKFHPRAIPELIAELPTAIRGLLRRKMTPAKILLHPHKAPEPVRGYFDAIERRDERYELNLYTSGYDEDESPAGATPAAGAHAEADPAARTSPEASANR